MLAVGSSPLEHWRLKQPRPSSGQVWALCSSSVSLAVGERVDWYINELIPRLLLRGVVSP